MMMPGQGIMIVPANHDSMRNQVKGCYMSMTGVESMQVIGGRREQADTGACAGLAVHCL